MLFVVLAACHSSPDDPRPGDPGGTPSDPTADPSWTVPDTVPPDFDAAALGDGLDIAVRRLQSLDVRPALDAYAEIMVYRDGGCPYSYGYDTTYQGYADTWYAQCETAGEDTFSGYAGLYTNSYYEGYRSVYLSAAATVLTADGRRWSASGAWSIEDSDEGAYRYRADALDGVYAYDGPAAAGTWIAEQLQASVLIEREEAQNGNWRTFSADGQLTGLTGPVDTVDLVDVSLDSRADCAEPYGTIALRTTAGDWFDVAFSGEDGEDGGCDGCGIARWRGLDNGEVCGDFTPWTTGGPP